MPPVTVGRVVHYYGREYGEDFLEQQPRAAIVTHVWNAPTGCVNLTVFESDGSSRVATSVLDESSAGEGASVFWRWPPRA